MYKEHVLEWLKKDGRLVFTTHEVSKLLNLRGSAASNLLLSMAENGHISQIARGRYYFNGAPVKDIFAIASKIAYPSYIATESAFERLGASNAIPRIIRVITTKARRPVKTKGADITFIKFKAQRFFGYNESRWISISSPEKAFVDSLYLGEFPFFTDLLGYHKKLYSYGHRLDYEKLVSYALRMDCKALVNRMGFFLDRIGKEETAGKLFAHIYRKGMVPIDRSGDKFNDREWMIA